MLILAKYILFKKLVIEHACTCITLDFQFHPTIFFSGRISDFPQSQRLKFPSVQLQQHQISKPRSIFFVL